MALSAKCPDELQLLLHAQLSYIPHVACAQGMYGEREVKIVKDNTLCFDDARVHSALQQCHGDADKAVERLIDELAVDDEAAVVDTDAAAMTPEQQVEQPASAANVASGAAGSSLCNVESQVSVQHPAGRLCEGDAARMDSSSDMQTCEGQPADNASDDGCRTPVSYVGGADVQSQDANRAQAQVFSSAADERTASGACGEQGAGDSNPASAEVDEHSKQAADKEVLAAAAASEAGSERGEEASGRESASVGGSAEPPSAGLPGTGASAASNGAAPISKSTAEAKQSKSKKVVDKRPAKNKLCPCKSGRKYKNCCKGRDDRKREAASAGPGAASASGASSRASLAALHLQTLNI
jgi:SEC-C motif